MADDDLTPWRWLTAVRDCVVGMDHWAEVDRMPGLVSFGNPHADLHRCDCTGAVAISAGQLIYVGDNFPDQAPQTRTLSRDDLNRWAVPVTVEFARCIPTLDNTGRAPTVDDENASAETLHLDAWALWRALLCCAEDWRRTIGKVSVGGLSPIQRPIGPCGGFSVALTCQVKWCEECE